MEEWYDAATPEDKCRMSRLQVPETLIEYIKASPRCDLWCRVATVIPCVCPHRTHFVCPLSHGADVPCHRTLPPSHATHVMHCVPLSGNQLI